MSHESANGFRVCGQRETWDGHPLEEHQRLWPRGRTRDKDHPLGHWTATMSEERPELGPGKLVAFQVAEDDVVQARSAVDPVDGVQGVANDFDVVTREATWSAGRRVRSGLSTTSTRPRRSSMDRWASAGSIPAKVTADGRRLSRRHPIPV